MLTVNTKSIIAAINEAHSYDPFSDFNEEQAYLAEKIVKPFASNEDVLLSNLDFSRFDLEDLTEVAKSFHNLRSDFSTTFSYAQKFIGARPLEAEVSYV